MSCPHSKSPSSKPESCSQCLGSTPKLVTVRNGSLFVDEQRKGVLTDINKAKYIEESESQMPQKVRACGMCRKPGHNSATCPELNPELN